MTGEVSIQPTSSIDTLKQRLDDPQVAAALNNLLDHADLLAIMLVGLDGFVSRSETIGEAIADGLADIRGVAGTASKDSNLDPTELFRSLVSLTHALPAVSGALTRVVDEGLIDDLLNSGVASPEMVEQVSRLGRGLVAGARQAETHQFDVKGPVSLVKLMRDPDIQRAINYFASVAKSIGQELKTPLNG